MKIRAPINYHVRWVPNGLHQKQDCNHSAVSAEFRRMTERQTHNVT